MSIFLAVDIDDTLCESAALIMERVHEEFGHPDGLTVEELRETYNQPGLVGGWEDEKIQLKVAEYFNNPDFLVGLPRIEGAVEGLYKLKAIFGLGAYITSRPEALRKPTEDWLKKNDFPPAPVWMRDIHQKAPNWKVLELDKKVDGRTALIDDTLEAFEGIDSIQKVAGVWFNRFHLEKQLPDKVKEVESWNEAGLIDDFLKRWVS